MPYIYRDVQLLHRLLQSAYSPLHLIYKPMKTIALAKPPANEIGNSCLEWTKPPLEESKRCFFEKKSPNSNKNYYLRGLFYKNIIYKEINLIIS